jgi:hypothetical protein
MPLSPCSRLERQENEAEPDMASFVKKRLRGSPDRTPQLSCAMPALDRKYEDRMATTDLKAGTFVKRTPRA